MKQTARILPSRLKRTGTFSEGLCRNSVGTGAKTPSPETYVGDQKSENFPSPELAQTVSFAYAGRRSVTLSFVDVEVLTFALSVAGGLSEGYPRE